MTDPTFQKPPLKRGLKVPPVSEPSHEGEGGSGFSPLQAKESFKSPPSVILPFLYLGSQANAANKKQLTELKITRILSVKERIAATEQTERDILELPMSDHGDTPIGEVLQECFAFIEETKTKNTHVLVHCRGGVNRSATIVLAYLMQCEKMTLKQAWNHVRTNRPQVAPHEGYLRQLRDLEQSLFGEITLEAEAAPQAYSLTRRIEEWRNQKKNGSLPGGLGSSATTSSIPDNEHHTSTSASDSNQPSSHKLDKDRRSNTLPVHSDVISRWSHEVTYCEEPEGTPVSPSSSSSSSSTTTSTSLADASSSPQMQPESLDPPSSNSPNKFVPPRLKRSKKEGD